MPDGLLTILKFCLLALLYLFFVRVLRAVWVETSGRIPESAPVPVPAGGGGGLHGGKGGWRRTGRAEIPVALVPVQG